MGWLAANRESAALAEELIAESAAKHGIAPGTLTLHAGNGSSMISKAVALLLADLGVTKSHSRPYVSGDNPFSESQFKTLKYRPDLPERFASLEEARSFCRAFFRWYNTEHRHSGIGMMTPDAMHNGQAAAVHTARQQVLDLAYAEHPERFVPRAPTPAPLPKAVYINPPRPAPAVTQEVLQ